jgi:hypothetical protein
VFKKAVLVILQTLFFLALFFAGSFLPVFQMLPMWRIAAGATHWLVLDGIFVMLAVWLLIVAIEAAMKRIRTAGALTTLAAALALALGLAMKFGFMDRLPGS